MKDLTKLGFNLKSPFIKLELLFYFRKRPEIVSSLHSGLQCSSCGDRFDKNSIETYRAHLDWHFRQNKKLKEKSRISRPWYFKLNLWTNFEEHEDPKVRSKKLNRIFCFVELIKLYLLIFLTLGKCYFETEETVKEIEVEPSVPTQLGNTKETCGVCYDVFESFFNDEDEQWHIKPAVHFDGLNFHPICLEDYKVRRKTFKFKYI